MSAAFLTGELYGAASRHPATQPLRDMLEALKTDATAGIEGDNKVKQDGDGETEQDGNEIEASTDEAVDEAAPLAAEEYLAPWPVGHVDRPLRVQSFPDLDGCSVRG